MNIYREFFGLLERQADKHILSSVSFLRLAINAAFRPRYSSNKYSLNELNIDSDDYVEFAGTKL